MIIGIPKEIKDNENRVGMVPGGVQALVNRGHRVSVFKKGPDYIDPMWLQLAAGRPAYNLDFNTMSVREIHSLFAREARGADTSLIEANKGPVIGMFNQYAHSGEGKTIHSVIQMESFGIIVNDRPKELRADGQKIVTPDGFEINLHIRDGLAYMDMKKPSQDDLERFPHLNAFLTNAAVSVTVKKDEDSANS